MGRVYCESAATPHTTLLIAAGITDAISSRRRFTSLRTAVHLYIVSVEPSGSNAEVFPREAELQLALITPIGAV